MKLEGVREKVFLDRYSLKDDDGNPVEKTPEEMWRRVAKGIASVEKKKDQKDWEEKFYNAMTDFKFVPGGRVLAGAGTGYGVTFFNCFVIPSPPDSRDGIMDNLKAMIEIMARGGGVGVNISSLRPRGARVKKVNGFSSGPCNWAEMYSVATHDIIQQGGCFSGDTRIMTHRGLLPIKEVVESKSKYYVTTHKGYKKITAKFNNGIKDLYEVTTASGFKVKTTLAHRFLTFDKNGRFHLKALSDLRKGDDVVHLLGEWSDELPYAALNTNLPIPSKYSSGLKDLVLPKVLNEDLAFIVGVYDADGSKIPDEFSPNGKGIRIAVSANRIHDLQTVIDAIKRCFHVLPTVRKGDGAVNVVQVFSRRLNEFLKVNGLLKDSSVRVNVPEYIFTSPQRVVEAYIAGVFLGDGTNRGGKGGLRIATVSMSFAENIQLLLLSLGIGSKIKVQARKEKNWRTVYTVTVNGKSFMERFLRLLAPYTEKVLDKKISVRNGFFGWPFNVTERFSYVPYFQRTMARTNPTTSQTSVQFLTQIIPIVQKVDRADVEFLGRCIPDTISSIAHMSKETVYDLEVEDVHLLSGNGFYTSNSRRGALMLMLWDWHPDIEEFITVKQDLRRINGANLSVCASDAFMEAVKNDKDWDLVFPDIDDPQYDEKWDGVLAHWKKLGKKVKVYKTVKARYLWDLICSAAWRSAEPGLVFMERYNKQYNNWYWNTINCVNPCVTGDTLVTVENGFKQARDLKVGDEILTPKGFKPIKKFYNNGKQRIIKISFSDGGSLRATTDHKLKVVRKNGKQEWVKVTDLKKGDSIMKLVLLGTFNERGKSNKNNRNQNKEDNNHYQQIGIEGSSIGYHNFAFLAKNKLRDQKSDAMMVQNSILDQLTFVKSEMSGGKIPIASTTTPISDVMSDSFLSSKRVKMNPYTKKERLLATSETIISNEKITISAVKVTKVVDTGINEEVFDVYEPETLTWITNGYISLDCGEEGLPSWGVCNLASLNLSAFVKGYAVDKKGEMDYESLAEHAKIAVRFQDDVVDADKYVYPEIKQMQLNGERRIGLGTLGLGDALIKMHLRYGSEEASLAVDKIYKTIRDSAYEESVDIACEKGPFPKINIKKHLQGYFIKQLPKNILAKMKKYGVRNSVLLQAAPTGTTSLLSGASSGVEPVYEFEYTHNGRLGKQVVFHSIYGEWKEKHPDEARPDYFVAANDLTPEDHVRVQSIVQKYVDASISKTVNAPNSHTVEDVKKLYTLAYEWGCKGITYMREGSRMGVLQRVDPSASTSTMSSIPNGSGQEKKEKEKTEVKEVTEPFARRPMVVEGFTYQVETPIGKTYVTINHNEGKPFEVFIANGKSGSDVSAMADALGRMISIMLRVAGPVPARERLRKIVSELAGLGGSRSVGFGENKVRSLPDAVAKVLARYAGFRVNGRVEDKDMTTNGNGVMDKFVNGNVQNGPLSNEPQVKEETSTVSQLSLSQTAQAASTTHLFDICPECGAGSLAYEEGCQKCYGCGYSAC